MRYFLWMFALAVVTVVSIMGFRGSTFSKPPLEVFPDMDRQLKFLEQSENNLFADGRSDRLPPPGTVVRGNALELNNVFSASPNSGSAAFRTGKDSDGTFIARIPEEVGTDMSIMRLGKEIYGIHCSACHGKYGNGRGVTAHFQLFPKNLTDPTNATNLFLEIAGPWPDGQIFNAITSGSASKIMLGMADKMSPIERWAVVLYVRALQDYVRSALKPEVPK